MSVTTNFEQVYAGLDALEEHLRNPARVLRKFAKGYRDEVKAILATGGIGSIPYAPSTRKRLETTGTSQVSSRGTVRATRVTATAGALKKHAKTLQSEGWSPAWQQKQDRLNKRLQNYSKAEQRFAKREARRLEARKLEAKQRALLSKPGASAKEFYAWEQAKKRLERLNQAKTGKRLSEFRTHPLQYMGRTIRAKIKDGDTLIVYSAANEVGKAQDEGAGPGGGKKSTTPKRAYIKTPDFDAQAQRLAHMFEHDLAEAFDDR